MLDQPAGEGVASEARPRPSPRRGDRSEADLASLFLGERWRRPVPAGTDLLAEGECPDRVIILQQGWMGLSKFFPDGRRLLADLILPVDLVVAPSATGVPLPFALTALVDSAILSIPESEFAALCHRVPGLHDTTLRLETAARIRLVERMLRLGRGSAYERLAYILLEIYLRLRTDPRGRDGRFNLPIGQRELGDLTGMTSIHVCRTLRRLGREGLVQHRDHEIVLADLPALARICGLHIADFTAHALPVRMPVRRAG